MHGGPAARSIESGVQSIEMVHGARCGLQEGGLFLHNQMVEITPDA